MVFKGEQDLPSGYITELKQKLHEKDATKSDRMKILTLLPINWSIRKTAHTMNTSRFLVAKARNLVKKKGILAIPVYILKTQRIPELFSNESEASSAINKNYYSPIVQVLKLFKEILKNFFTSNKEFY